MFTFRAPPPWRGTGSYKGPRQGIPINLKTAGIPAHRFKSTYPEVTTEFLPVLLTFLLITKLFCNGSY